MKDIDRIPGKSENDDMMIKYNHCLQKHYFVPMYRSIASVGGSYIRGRKQKKSWKRVEF